MDKLPQDDGEAVRIYLMVIVFFLTLPQRDRAIKLLKLNHNLGLSKLCRIRKKYIYFSMVHMG